MELKPITPQEAVENLSQNTIIPNEFIKVLNDLILEKFDGSNPFNITWNDLKRKYSEFGLICPHRLNFDFKPQYIKSGWNVQWIKESNAWEDGFDRWEFSIKRN